MIPEGYTEALEQVKCILALCRWCYSRAHVSGRQCHTSALVDMNDESYRLEFLSILLLPPTLYTFEYKLPPAAASTSMASSRPTIVNSFFGVKLFSSPVLPDSLIFVNVSLIAA